MFCYQLLARQIEHISQTKTRQVVAHGHIVGLEKAVIQSIDSPNHHSVKDQPRPENNELKKP